MIVAADRAEAFKRGKTVVSHSEEIGLAIAPST